jgi:hypothetical protein
LNWQVGSASCGRWSDESGRLRLFPANALHRSRVHPLTA